jgi:hypothetical protein
MLQKCKPCLGGGKLIDENRIVKNCPSCEGTGKVEIYVHHHEFSDEQVNEMIDQPKRKYKKRSGGIIDDDI